MEQSSPWAFVPAKAMPSELRRFFVATFVIPLAGTPPPA
jgi:hypothetical protein